MIQREASGGLTAVCEDCGDTFYAGRVEFSDFITWIKEQGWEIRRVGDRWEHYCPECGSEPNAQ